MGAISDFVAAFSRDYEKYLSIEKEVRKLCEDALRGIQFLWDSRVKAVESLEKKLKDRNQNYDGESENVADIVDLVAGRIILADWRDFDRVEEIIKNSFDFRGRIQHPKPGQKSVNSQSRFRGYGGRHFHVTRKSGVYHHSCDPVIEIQVMTAYMWTYATLAHDIEYKKLHGEPSEDLVLSLEALKGIANLGEISLDIFNRQFLPVARVSHQQNDIGLHLSNAIQEVETSFSLDENDKQCIRDIRVTDPRHDKERIEASKDQLLEGSCSWVLEDPAFVEWWTCDDSRLLWIHGDPGKGKTMMMIALISEVSKRLSDRPGSNVLAYFFCQNTSTDLNTTLSVLRGLIYLLVDQERKLVRHIRKQYDSAGKKLFEGPNAMYAMRMILSDILKDESLGNTFLMIDALDECDAEIHELLDWITRKEPGISPKIKWLTTSRNVPAFAEQLGRGHQLQTSLELNSQHVACAVASFVNHKVKELAVLKSYDRELQVLVQKSLLDKAEDTFLWVALACKELSKVRRQKVRSFLEKIPTGLVSLYERMLKQILHQEDLNDIVLSRRILCSVTIALRPLRFGEIAVFAEIPGDEDVETLVGLCGSFLTIRGETVYLVHQSAKDYLSEENTKELFIRGKEHEHANRAQLCLRIMSSSLRKDICNLQTPGYRLEDVEHCSIEAHIPFYAQYACLYWVDHLQRAGSTNQKTLTLGEDCQVLGFFKDHFLHWLEALVLMRKLSEAVLAMRSIGSMQKSQMSSGLFSFVNDAQRFILEFRSILETAPLQTYVSALVFCPEISIVKRQFSYELPNWIERLPIVEEAWPASLQTLQGNSRVTEVVFSPDGQLLASVHEKDLEVRVWDISTGALRGTLKGSEPRTGYIYETFFLSNNQLLTCASTAQFLRIWNPVTAISQDVIEDQFDRISATAFSPDGRLLASASEDTFTIRLWDSLRGTLQGTLEGHLSIVKMMTFAPPNGQLLASVSDDRTFHSWNSTIHLWNSSTGKIRHKLEGHLGSISAMVFSPLDGRLLASAADYDFTIRLWDTSTGVLRGMLQGHEQEISSIFFSPNGQLLFSMCFGEEAIRLWDPATGASKGIIEGITSMIASTISPNGRLLAVSSYNMVQLWDSATRALHSTLEGHSEIVKTIQFSRDGHLLATGSYDETVRLWDVVTETSQDKLEGHSSDILTIVFSPCGHLVASGSMDSTIILWDSATGTPRNILNNIVECSSIPTAMNFSPNSQLLALGHSSGTLELVDPATGTSLAVLEGHTAQINAVIFSPSGQILASGDMKSTIRLWDPNKADSRGVFYHSESGEELVSLAFSTDGQILASASIAGSINLWDVKRCTSQAVLEGDGPIRDMTFSPDNQLLALATSFDTVKVWNIETGTLIKVNGCCYGGNWLIRIPSSCDESAHEQAWTASPYAIDVEDEWVTYKGRKVLWLPHNRRPYEYAIHENSLVLGSKIGRVTFLHFSKIFAPPGI